jgi:hypothetical protein
MHPKVRRYLARFSQPYHVNRRRITLRSARPAFECRFQFPDRRAARAADGIKRNASARFAAAAHREPTTCSRIPLVAHECIVMKVGNWIILAVLLGMLSGTIWIGYDIWKTTADVPISENGYVAMGVGAALSLLIGCGLIALLFYSSRHGYDEPPHEDNRLHRK